ncbi:exodeoxyribonuclease VII small subunit, partial [bacterium LRH843]|nr:exodeoxyribonuclease VII small subunit [bacterium LRH843]
VVDKLESGELSLEDSLKAYEKGVELVRSSQGKLNAIEGRIEELMKDGSTTEFKGEGARDNDDDAPF